MKRLFLIAGLFIALLAIYFYTQKEALQPAAEISATNPETPATITSDLPPLPISTLDNTQLMVNTLQGKTALYYFQPDCDHCQREAVQIRENLKAFEGYTIYFISSEVAPMVLKFAQEYKLNTISNIKFATTSLDNILNIVGPMDAPSLYLYAVNGKLKKSFNGETPIEKILPHL